MRVVLALVAALVVLVLGAPSASAEPRPAAPASLAAQGEEQGPDAEELARRFSPVIVVRNADDPCGDGEHYVPTAVDALLGRDDVQLLLADGSRKPAPQAGDFAGKEEGTYLDLPGNPLKPGCVYSRWAAELDAIPTVYARVASDAAVPGQLALQYWMFWPYNDWNNRHEGDWEMIQLNFDATTAAEALRTDPASTIFAQHEGGETAAWTDPKVHRDGDHIAVYPGQGSHASFYDQRLWIGKSAEAGFGCDNTSVGSGVTARRLDPAVVMLTDQPWLSYTGRWGAQAPSFNNGPTGPNTKTQWEHPIQWSLDQGRPDAIELPRAPGIASRTFCRTVEMGSLTYIALLRSNLAVGVGLVLVIALLGWLIIGTRWRSVDPTRLEQPRQSGEVLVSSAGVLRRSPRLFLPLVGAQIILLTIVRSALIWINRPRPTGDLTNVNGAVAGPLAWLVNVALGSLIIVSSAVIMTLAMERVHRLAGRLPAQGSWIRRSSVLRGAVLLVVGVYLAITIPVVGLIVLAFFVLSTPWAVVTGDSLGRSLAASMRLTRRLRLPTGGLVAAIAGLVFLGPLVGALLMLATDVPSPVAWLIAAAAISVATVWGGVALVLALYSAEQVAQPVEEPELVS